MAALRAVTRFPGKSSALMSFQDVHLNGSFSTFCPSPTRATPRQLVRSLSPHLTSFPTRRFFTVIESYERGIIFRCGRHAGGKEPGIRWSVPLFNEVRKVDMRTRTMQIPSQELMTKDNVTIHVDAVAFYKVEDPLKALCNIENWDAAVNEAAQTSVRDQLSRAAFDEVLHEREEAGRNVHAALYKLTANWGVVVEAVKLKNIRVDASMIRAMGRVAEAERVREARLIEASAEYEASLKLVEAGRQFGSGDGILGLRLREMQNHAQIAAEKNTTMMIIPANLDAGVAGILKTANRDLESERRREEEEDVVASKVRTQKVAKDQSEEASDGVL